MNVDTSRKVLPPSTNLLPTFYRKADGVIIFIDVTDTNALESSKDQLQKVDRYGEVGVKKLVVGTKIDVTNKRVVDYSKTKELFEAQGTIRASKETHA